jgi:valyl-tRNA synthetase
VKPELQSAGRERATVAWKNLFAAFDAALRLMHPFMPFLTEELWHQLPQKAGAKSIALDQFPRVHDHWKNAGATEEVDTIQEVVTALRTIRAELKLDPKKRATSDFSTSDTGTDLVVQANRKTIERFAVLTELRVVPREQFDGKSGAVRSTAKFDVRIAYSDAVDVTAEKERLKKEIEGLKKAIASKERQLEDPTFRSRAPEKIIKGLEATLAEQRGELKKLQDRLDQLDQDS